MSFRVLCLLNSARGRLVAARGGAVAGHSGLYRAVNPNAVEAVATHLLAAGNSLEHFPYRGRRVAGTGMPELIANYRYIIRCRAVRERVVHILRIRHSSRRPTIP